MTPLIRIAHRPVSAFIGLLGCADTRRDNRDGYPTRSLAVAADCGQVYHDSCYARCRAVEQQPPRATWPQRLAGSFGPGYLCGITLGAWLDMLRAARFSIAPRCWPRAASISALSVVNSVLAAYEGHRAVGSDRPQPEGDGADNRKSKIQNPKCVPPLFILGHWRSGTTHLHRLLAADERFIAPALFQVLYPKTFRSTQGWLPTLLTPLLTPTRKIDNMPLDLDGPAEDEWALCTLFGKSPYLSMALPRCERAYDRYLTLRDVSDAERRRWQAALREFVGKVWLAALRPEKQPAIQNPKSKIQNSSVVPLLKSPPHTGRIRLLLEAFPRAKFVHIHRHPFEVFQSMRRLLAGWHERHHLQKRDLARLDDRIIRQYAEMYEAFFEERSLIPDGCFHELRFDALAREPERQLRELYARLSLPPFENAQGAVREYVESVAGYERNHYGPLPTSLRARLAREWRQSFDEWGYDDA